MPEALTSDARPTGHLANAISIEAVVFTRMMEGPAAADAEPRTVATYLKAYRTTSSLRVKRDFGRLIGCTKGGMNTKAILSLSKGSVSSPMRMDAR